MSDLSSRVAELELENDLLRHENRFLRSMRSGPSQDPHGSSNTADVEELRQALNDLRGFIRRLASTPARPLLRLSPGFRYLEDRYVHNKDVKLR